MCIFCKIARKEEKAYIVYESERVLAFLDIFPISKGHTLVIPKDHYENILEMPSGLAEELYEAVKIVCEKLRVFNPDGFNILTNIGKQAGQEIMHAHIHVIPRYKGESGRPVSFGKQIEVDLEEVHRSLV
jgi:histidine triad (HIT) family protein